MVMEGLETDLEGLLSAITCMVELGWNVLTYTQQKDRFIVIMVVAPYAAEQEA
jgi:hypothetical protein